MGSTRDQPSESLIAHDALANLMVVLRCLQHGRHQCIPTLDTSIESALTETITAAEGTFPERLGND